MTALARLIDLGLEVGPGPTPSTLRLAGLDRLSRPEAEGAMVLARKNKAEILDLLRTQGSTPDDDRDQDAEADVETGLSHFSPEDRQLVDLGFWKLADVNFGRGEDPDWRVVADHEAAERRLQPAGPVVHCADCAHYQPSKSSEAGLGFCQAQPWDGHKGQWPRKEHTCGRFRDKDLLVH